MKTLSKINNFVLAQLLLYHRKKFPFGTILFLVVFLAIAKLNNGKGAFSIDTILPWLILIIIMANGHLIVCPFFSPDDELRKLWLFPLEMDSVIAAKYIASTIVLLSYVFLSFLAATILFPIPLIEVGSAFMHFLSILISLYILGILPIWPVNIHREATFVSTMMYSIAVVISSLPYMLVKTIPMAPIICGVWIVFLFLVWKIIVLPRSGAWLIEKFYRRGEA